ncbi:MAG: hypothetical protein HOV87_17380 [Catenulispora sp.]|nr:hypothetical protein [Catenulispora sp.]
MTYVLLACHAVLVGVFVLSVRGKLRTSETLAADVAAFRIVPERLSWAAASATVAAELTAAVLLAVPGAGRGGFLLSAALLLVFTAVIVQALIRRLNVPCPCFGASTAPVGKRHVLRNAVFLGFAVFGAWQDGQAGHPSLLRERTAMPYVVAALVLVGGVACLNLVLTFAMIRAAKGQPAPTALGPVPGPPGPTSGPGHATKPNNALPAELVPGSAVEPFTARATDGSEVDWSQMDTDGMLVGFFSTACASCRMKVPEFVGNVAVRRLGRGRALALVVGDPAEMGDSVATLAEACQVVVEDVDGPVATAFGGVHSFPRFVVFDAEGRITASSPVMWELPEAVRA